jgi:hypothetical protein
MEDYVLWTYGWGKNESMPPYIKACHYTMKVNSGCKLVVVTPDNVNEYIKDLPKTFYDLIPPHQADIFRIDILYHYGGMYLDGDTVVMKSLLPLFNLLNKVDLVGKDWKPKQLPKNDWQDLGVSVMGPMKPKLPFMKLVKEKQRHLLSKKLPILAISKKILPFLDYYPFVWEELLSPIVNACFKSRPPKSIIGDGTSSWFSLVGGPGWHGGDLKDPLRQFLEIKELPETELFTLANSILPDDIKSASLDYLLSQDTILANLLLKALKIEGPKQLPLLKL